MNKQKETLKALCEGAIVIAMAWALSYVELDFFLQGGAIGVTMLPLFLYSMRHGVGWGIVACTAFGCIKSLLGDMNSLSLLSFLMDYFLAYSVVGLTGIYKGKNKWCIAPLIGGIARFFIHYISGITIYAEYMPDVFWGIPMASPFVYSALYNGAYVLPSVALCIVLIGIMTRHKVIKDFIKA